MWPNIFDFDPPYLGGGGGIGVGLVQELPSDGIGIPRTAIKEKINSLATLATKKPIS